jgi:hypothetical protein
MTRTRKVASRRAVGARAFRSPRHPLSPSEGRTRPATRASSTRRAVRVPTTPTRTIPTAPALTKTIGHTD